jgi:hypothetical protein
MKLDILAKKVRNVTRTCERAVGSVRHGCLCESPLQVGYVGMSVAVSTFIVLIIMKVCGADSLFGLAWPL